MGVIHCCGSLRKSKSFVLQPSGDFLEVRMDWLESCPHCSHTVLQLTRLSYDNRISVIRKTNYKARKLREKLESEILYEINSNSCHATAPAGNFYLYYNEYGKKKKCFSNLSCLKMGLFENMNLSSENLLLCR